MTTESAKNKCFALMIASQDSTAAFVAALMNNLIQHAHIYKSPKDEITAFERKGNFPRLLSNLPKPTLCLYTSFAPRRLLDSTPPHQSYFPVGCLRVVWN